MKINFRILIICFLIVYSIAFIGSVFNSGTTDSEWYFNNRPSITPPNYVFPIVWNVLFFLIALSLYFCWINSNKKQKKKIILVYGINLLLNALWSFLFFKMQNPLASFVELIALEFSIWLMIFVSWRIDRRASYLLIPYLLWVSFAGVLNWLWVF